MNSNTSSEAESGGSPDRKADSGVDLSTTEVSSEAESVAASSDSLDSGGGEAVSSNRSVTLPSKLDIKQIDWDELDDLLQVGSCDNKIQVS